MGKSEQALKWNMRTLHMIGTWAAEGLSGSQIASKFEDATRNMVIGYCSRNGIKLHGSATSFVKKAPDKAPDNDGVIPLLIPLVALTDHTCKWPYGDPKIAGFGFCGHAIELGQVYCAPHRREAYKPILTGLAYLENPDTVPVKD